MTFRLVINGYTACGSKCSEGVTTFLSTKEQKGVHTQIARYAKDGNFFLVLQKIYKNLKVTKIGKQRKDIDLTKIQRFRAINCTVRQLADLFR